MADSGFSAKSEAHQMTFSDEDLRRAMELLFFAYRDFTGEADALLADFGFGRDAKLHVLSHALHYASAVFEGERCYGGKIFKLTEHSERLAFSAGELGFELPYSVAEVDAACIAVC